MMSVMGTTRHRILDSLIYMLKTLLNTQKNRDHFGKDMELRKVFQISPTLTKNNCTEKKLVNYVTEIQRMPLMDFVLLAGQIK